ncbi:hypothetical protein COV19_03655 [Candidatus Woesearchaeota archaeon CG10_big_fil_rev_8_21_14_0_10_44_13]|nr:MAG: hypothetical protein COV19_03655 [Candidatus Woesearchaeota archaeon CG10_big_fil_rev_8_21_14_0_10_44_13]
MARKKDILLEELAIELEGMLHVIAHAGRSSDRRFIRRRQDYLKDKYGHTVSDDVLRTPIDETPVEIAYAIFMHVLDGEPKPSSKEIAQNCEEILYDHLI